VPPGKDESLRAELLLRFARQVTARHALDDVLTEVFRCLRPVVRFGGGSIQLLDDDGWIHMAAADPPAPADVMSQRVPLATSTAGRVILTEAAVYLPDIAQETHGKRVASGVRSYLGVPLVADGHAIGVLQIDSPLPEAWTEDDRSLFAMVAPIVAAAIQNARAYNRAILGELRAEGLEARLHEIAEMIAAAQSAVRMGDVEAAQDALALADALIDGRVDVSVPTRLPTQRASTG
jgi:GAF domain-containing protein